ncbi:UDP-glucuronosyl/UDP-glucosyltransferase [Sesbania bispinosa]|nr:UDP-glucuronosyl/UDP-glucosyltransferase [Sesbania bispinosa]
MMQLGMALENSGKNFVWVVRPSIGFDINLKFRAEEWLLEGHYEWNSVLKSLSHGVPILGWPMAVEQFFNCKLLEEELGVCVKVARGKSCEVKHEDVMATIELVMNYTDNGMKMRQKVVNIRDIIRNSVKDEGVFKGSSIRFIVVGN